MNMEKIYNKLSKDYDDFYLNGINYFLKNNNEKYCLFYPSFGIKKGEDCDFLIYGQALNGWGDTVINSEEDLDLNKIIFSFNNYLSERSHTPLDWVNVYWTKADYNEHMDDPLLEEFYGYEDPYLTYRSFFWNLTYKTVSSYYNFEKGYDFGWGWSKKIVWSNLYKIAPLKGNPNDQLKKDQFEFNVELFRKEIEEINPKFCLVFTNQSWFEPFKEFLKLSNIYEKESTVITSVYRYKNTKIIVTNRPFGGNSDFYSKEVLKELT